MARISLDELEDYLWDSAVLLRTHIDAGVYKQYIFPLLFFKRICDVYDEECVQILKEYNGDEEALTWEENHKFMVPKGHHWKDVRALSRDIGSGLTRAFRAIERANVDKLHGIFGNAAWTNKNRLPDSLLKDLIEHFSSRTLSLANCPEDELGQGYEYLIKQFADDSGHTAQEFYTNRTVVHLMTEILQPKSGESVYDPTCGSAGMLISCIAHLQKQKKEWRNVKLYGQEITQLTAAIGKMNLFLHGIKDFQIVNDDTLKNPAFIERGELKRFDVVLANPPYSIKQWDRTAFENDKWGRNILGTPNQNRADYAFIQHILKSMDEKSGRCAILLPHGILNRLEELSIRQKMILKDYVECVIGLGKNLFYNSPMESCILICRSRKSPEKKGKTLFIDAKRYVTRKGTEFFITNQDIDFLRDVYMDFKNKKGVSAVANINDINNNNFSLSIGLYVKQATEQNEFTLDDTKGNIQNWLKSSANCRKLYETFKTSFLKDDIYAKS